MHLEAKGAAIDLRGANLYEFEEHLIEPARRRCLGESQQRRIGVRRQRLGTLPFEPRLKLVRHGAFTPAISQQSLTLFGRRARSLNAHALAATRAAKRRSVANPVRVTISLVKRSIYYYRLG